MVSGAVTERQGLAASPRLCSSSDSVSQHDYRQTAQAHNGAFIFNGICRVVMPQKFSGGKLKAFTEDELHGERYEILRIFLQL